MATMDYVESVREWQAQMDAELHRENSWVTQAGLYWLNEGVNTFGSSPDCTIRLPGQVPRLLGAIELTGGIATLQVDLGLSVDVNGVPTSTATVLSSEDEAVPSIISFHHLGMGIVRQGGGVGLRLWDNTQARNLPPRKWFDVDERYRVRGLYTPYVAPVKVQLPTVLGQVETGYVQGYLSFKLGGKPHNLDAAELPDGRLYLQFADLTNGAKTYPSGRYLRTEPVLEDGQVFVDFNRAYNPPCAFKESEPCTFAPSGNHLKAAIEAGEQYTGKP
jgi:uncharacterized protein (DUF1684 family)